MCFQCIISVVLCLCVLSCVIVCTLKTNPWKLPVHNWVLHVYTIQSNVATQPHAKHPCPTRFNLTSTQDPANKFKPHIWLTAQTVSLSHKIEVLNTKAKRGITVLQNKSNWIWFWSHVSQFPNHNTPMGSPCSCCSPPWPKNTSHSLMCVQVLVHFHVLRPPLEANLQHPFP